MQSKSTEIYFCFWTSDDLEINQKWRNIIEKIILGVNWKLLFNIKWKEIRGYIENKLVVCNNLFQLIDDEGDNDR